jgi:hypothetical protein
MQIVGPTVQPGEAFILYTYQAGTTTSTPTCHAYGPLTLAAAQNAGGLLVDRARSAGEPTLTFMTLPIEPLPV